MNSIIFNPDRIYGYIDSLAKRNIIDQNLATKVRGGQVILSPFAITRRVSINGASNRVELMDETVSKADGLANIDRAKLPSDNFMVIEGIRLAYSDASNVDPKAVANYTTTRSTWDPALYNASLELHQEGQSSVILELPCSLFTSTGSGTGIAAESEVFTLPDLRYLLPEQVIKPVLVFAGTVAETESSIELNIVGRRFKLRN